MSIFDFLFPLRFKSSAKTDKGKKRPHNEDTIYCNDKQKLYIVADGIGGHGRGEYASSQSIKLFSELLFDRKFQPAPLSREQLRLINFENVDDINTQKLPELTRLVAALHKTNEQIYQENRKLKDKAIDGKERGMGTTFSGCWFLPGQKRVLLFNIGDSRVYLLRDEQFVQRTHDHSMRQYWLDNGQHGEPPPKNIILRAIGPKQQIEPDIEVANIKKGDTWLICSDGLHGMINDKQLHQFITDRVADKSLSNYQTYAPRLLDKANYAGGLDNISVILIHIQ